MKISSGAEGGGAAPLGLKSWENVFNSRVQQILPEVKLEWKLYLPGSRKKRRGAGV
jgi:hypothetical protein